MHTLARTVDTMSEALDDVVVNELTATGARTRDADLDNIPRFWEAAIGGRPLG